ncbi:rRNA maturation factor [Duganella sp. Leaf126]|uniref:rRNA maturation RNase YbeY n=1 Tax=Duganella sp. Leaf126 TaxID=1736266 RepID=UPI0006FA898C|nr:rRNA maturation RNase YbeY [Duganella sp. Leaf126]KQQ47295.1 rRNA maturation factor [Duganella sp. Leaf126]
MSEKNSPPAHALALSVQYPDPRLKTLVTRAKLKRWIGAALFAPAELTIRFVAADEGRSLNRDYRGKDYATNVLTFAYNEGDEAGNGVPDDEPTRADIILCTDVLEQEAAAQHKTVEEHVAHLVVHGVLHAQGYDHEDDDEAAEMEALETELLATLGFADPYAQEKAHA